MVYRLIPLTESTKMPNSIKIIKDASALDSFCSPRMYSLTKNISALQFEVMKLVPARYIIEKGMEDNLIKKSTTIVESSSGTFALALAIVCAHYGLKLKLVTGPVAPIVSWRLEGLGAELDIVMPTGGEGGLQQDRMNHLKRVMAESEDFFWTRQHSSPMNPFSYERLISSRLEEFAHIDYLICSTGTGGSITGISRKMREISPNLKVVGVDHNLSYLFGPTSGQVSRLCNDSYYPMLGIGADVVPPNLDHSVCDQVHWMPVNEMIDAAHELNRKYGIFIGPTGAATYKVAQHLVSNHSDKNVICIFPDHGVRYVDTIYNAEWLASYGSDVGVDSASRPKQVASSQEVTGKWAFYNWNRRTYKEVHGFDCLPRT
jgi:S-sulfo-L-cysteine synthase (3-phospho-L-serine-dependent)